MGIKEVYSIQNNKMKDNLDDYDIIAFLSKYVDISKELESAILKHSKIKQFSKKSIVLKEGQIARECFFVLKGCMKKYFLKDGEEKITAFYTEGNVITPSSYTNKLPSKYFISTLENTIVLHGDPASEEEIYKEHPQLESLTRVLVEKIMVNKNDEFDYWVSNSPEERYQLLIKNRPELIQRVPQYQIANYLGIKPESLSRIRKRLAK